MPFQDLTPAKRRRAVARAVVRSLVTVAILVTLYYELPLDQTGEVGSALLVALGLVGVVVLLLAQLRAIISSDYPALQAVEGLTLVASLFLLVFAAAYYLLERATPDSFNTPLTRTDALYFTVTTFATVGFGDITAVSQGARILVTVQMVVDLILVGVGVKVLFGAVQARRQQQGATGFGTPRSSPPPTGSQDPPAGSPDGS